jgi:tetratricopeptide (TPR) repeat protein
MVERDQPTPLVWRCWSGRLRREKFAMTAHAGAHRAELRAARRSIRTSALRSPVSLRKHAGRRMEAINASQLANLVLGEMNAKLAAKFGADVMFIQSAMMSPLDGQFRIEVETVKTGPDSADKLCLFLETTGGYIETVKRLVDVMRRHYKEVSFVIPNYAYSAGTVLALSGDRIYMDYYSILGPIDPQMADETGQALLPGLGYLAKFEELLETINAAKAKDPNAKQAELAYLIKRFDPAKLFHIEQAIEHGQALIEEWLPKWKFKSWTKTDTGKKVTPTMRKKRAQEVATVLGDAKKWHSHGRGISMAELRGEEIKLLIDDFGKDKDLSMQIRNYHGLAIDYAQKQGFRGFIHTKNGMRRIS